MSQRLQHRGPDDSGLAELGGSGGGHFGAFGHRRLAILDLSSAGHQPMFSADGRLCLTYNGEIYNFAELKRGLEREGARFQTRCDTEVILAGWARMGPSFLRQMRGMFALALWDADEERGYLARDAFGIKPLYFAERGGDLIFASEVRAILATGRIPRVISPDGLHSYLATGSVEEPHTIIDGIMAVPAGSVIPVARAGSDFAAGAPERFAAAPADAEPQQMAAIAHARRIRDVLRESVAYHLVSDVPVGVFLSGGVDSSAIAGLASEVSATPVESFTVVFDEAEYNEAEAAREAAHRFGTVHHEIPLSSDEVLAALPDFLHAMDQPSLDGMNTFLVSRAVKSAGLKVALSGLGGDELFGGYPSFRRASTVAPLWKLPPALRKLGARGARSLSGDHASRVNMLLAQDTPASGAYRASRSLFGERRISRLMRNKRAPRDDAAKHASQAGSSSMTLMQQVSQYELTGYMRNTLLRDSDVFSMAHGLELRVPIVDPEVARAAHDAAAALDIRGGGLKPMLVDAVRDLLPASRASSQKKGFTLPFELWMRGALAGEISSILESGGAYEAQLDRLEVGRVWEGFQKRRGGMSWSRPWALYTLVQWAALNDISFEI